MTRSAWFRWSVYGAGLTACGVAMVVLADASGFDPLVGLCGTLAIVGAVLATWAMMRSPTMETVFGVLAVNTLPGEVAPGAMVGLRIVKGCPVHGRHIMAEQFIEPHEARTMGKRILELADKADADNERHALGEPQRTDDEAE